MIGLPVRFVGWLADLWWELRQAKRVIDEIARNGL
jgi:hypothetical protein